VSCCSVVSNSSCCQPGREIRGVSSSNKSEFTFKCARNIFCYDDSYDASYLLTDYVLYARLGRLLLIVDHHASLGYATYDMLTWSLITHTMCMWCSYISSRFLVRITNLNFTVNGNNSTYESNSLLQMSSFVFQTEVS